MLVGFELSTVELEARIKRGIFILGQFRLIELL